MEHIHTIRIDLPRSTRVFCEGCDIALRLATFDEAVFIEMTDGLREDGPMLGPTNVTVVPVDYSLFQEA